MFCHAFDLAKRLTLPVGSAVNYIAIPRTTSASSSPFTSILQSVRLQLASTPAHTVHRLVIPSLLSPALYPPTSSHPNSVLQFLHALRALLRQYPTRLTAVLTLPLSLYPRSSGLVRWMEILCDGVLELSPFPYSHAQMLAQSAGTTKDEEKPQGMFAVHKLPVFHEKGGGGGAEDLGEDMAFTLSRRKFVIAKFSLPPLEGDTEAQEAAVRRQLAAVQCQRKRISSSEFLDMLSARAEHRRPSCLRPSCLPSRFAPSPHCRRLNRARVRSRARMSRVEG